MAVNLRKYTAKTLNTTIDNDNNSTKKGSHHPKIDNGNLFSFILTSYVPASWVVGSNGIDKSRQEGACSLMLRMIKEFRGFTLF
ncbi:hypothetical protein GCM10011391_08430 [Pullulanibacillus camelliae]|uniref:Uncharacterized protein n=1 Tax=Pullulanibacillus camelliae TaxID=1707096 RepID=A0A8J2VMG0_9BACL|nr:hypothetical protein GCM10011391_08430 [Pullulanibacillus camelliae]